MFRFCGSEVHVYWNSERDSNNCDKQKCGAITGKRRCNKTNVYDERCGWTNTCSDRRWIVKSIQKLFYTISCPIVINYYLSTTESSLVLYAFGGRNFETISRTCGSVDFGKLRTFILFIVYFRQYCQWAGEIFTMEMNPDATSFGLFLIRCCSSHFSKLFNYV